MLRVGRGVFQPLNILRWILFFSFPPLFSQSAAKIRFPRTIHLPIEISFSTDVQISSTFDPMLAHGTAVLFFSS